MAQLIKLKLRTGTYHWVNPDHIVSMANGQTVETAASATLYMVDGKQIDVEDSVEAIDGLCSPK